VNPGIQSNQEPSPSAGGRSLPTNEAARKYEAGRRYLTAAEVSYRLGLSEPSIWHLSRTGGFPLSVAVQDGSRRWLEDDVYAYMMARIRARSTAPPARPRPVNIAPVDPATLIWPPLGLRKLIFESGRKCGVYFLLQGDVVVYVGSSVGIVARVGSHCENKGKVFDGVSWLQIKESHLLTVERAWILALKPKFNGVTDKSGARRYFAPDPQSGFGARLSSEDVQSSIPLNARSATLPQCNGLSLVSKEGGV
jgi:predicted DNA-binding transcriptional regulator AlpA